MNRKIDSYKVTQLRVALIFYLNYVDTLIIRKENKKYFFGKTYNNKKYKIMKNEYSKKLHLGSDIYFYAKRSEGLFIDTLIPISDEEAGVRDIR